MRENIMAGYCQCGCGSKTGFYKTSDSRASGRAGDPIPFMKGHRRRIFGGDFQRRAIIPIGPSIAYIPLTKGYFALIDREDAEWLGKWNWAVATGRCLRAKRSEKINGEDRELKMHRVIAGASSPEVLIDHRNGNGLDNRRSNLRDCSNKQNLWNRGKQKNNPTGFKGVSYHSSGLLRARIVAHGKEHYLGYFKTVEEAAAAYRVAAIELHGEFACADR